MPRLATEGAPIREQLHPERPLGSVSELAVSLWRDSLERNRKRFSSMRDELDFVSKLSQYHYERGQTRDRRLVQPHSAELFHYERHKWSQAARIPIFIETRPQNPEHDSFEQVEDAKIALESVVYDRQRGYMRSRRRAIMGAIMARSWLVAVDNVEPYGLVFRSFPRWRYHLPAGWQDHHDLTCPWVMEEATMRLSDIRAMSRAGWENTDQVRPDPGPTPGSWQRGQTLGTSSTDPTSETEVATVLKWWVRSDPEHEERQGQPRFLPQEQQFGECPLCGFQTEAPHQVEGVEACPACGIAPLLQVSQVVDVEFMPKHPDGRLVILAPLSPGNDGKPVKFYDKSWPYKLRSFPYMMVKDYEDPIEVEGQSDTGLHWYSVVILNGIRAFCWEQMRRNVDLLVSPMEGLFTGQGQPWSFNDLHGQVAYYKDAFKIQGLQHFQGSGIPAGAVAFHSMMLGPFQSSTGTSDLGGLMPERSRDIPVGTVRQLVQQGDIPLQDFLDLLQDEESIFFGVVLDMLVQTWGPERAQRYLGPDGQFRIKRLAQTALSSMEVVVSASPTLSTIKTDEIEALVRWAQLPIELRAEVAMLANLPMSIVRRIERNRAALQAQSSGTPAGGVSGGVTPGGAAPGNRLAEMLGASGNGSPAGLPLGP